MSKKFSFILVLFGISLVFSSCSENSIDFYVDNSETLKTLKISSFYGPQARKNCEIYRKFYSGVCDTTQEFVTCVDINPQKYSATKCK